MSEPSDNPAGPIPVDILLVLLGAGAMLAVTFTPLSDVVALRVVVGVPFLLLVPGYALIAAVFPESTRSPTEIGRPDESNERGIDITERLGLSAGVSFAVVPLLCLGLAQTRFGIEFVPVVATVGSFTIIGTVVAVVRRRARPVADQFSVRISPWIDRTREGLLDTSSTFGTVLNVAVVVALLLAVSSVGYAVHTHDDGERYTEFYLLTETADGELVADDYPRNVRTNESRSLVAGVQNYEFRQADYTVVVMEQQTDVVNGSTVVTEQREIDRFSFTLEHNETWQQVHTVSPTFTGDDVRIGYYLYRGDQPADPSAENAYRSLHLRINVSSAA